MADQLNTAEAARELGVSSSWISKLVKKDRLRPAKKLTGVRGAFLFERSEIERFKAAS